MAYGAIFVILRLIMNNLPPVERHPWPPYVPPEPRLLMLGTFPPKRERWSMDFFYPNRINDMWRIVGLVFAGRADALCKPDGSFDLELILPLLDRHGIALWDTAMAVRRLADNASDKFLDIVSPIRLAELLDAHPTIATLVATGQKAATVVAHQSGCPVPAIGKPVEGRVGEHHIKLWRMPSSSRAYPLSLERKAQAYAAMFADALGIVSPLAP